jgi:glutathione S-transferase
MLTLYYAPGTVARAVLITLHEIGVAFDAKRLNFATAQQLKPKYTAINPKGRVPTLITAEGVLTETPAILAYLARAHPAADLAPTDPFAMAKMQEFNCYLASGVHVAHAHKLRGSRWADRESTFADMRTRVAGNMAAAFQLIEDDYLQGPWVMGEQYTVADAYLFTVSGWLQGDGVDINTLPRVAAHFERMSARPAVQAALTQECA